MSVVRLNDTLIEIDGRARVERGPAPRTSIATKEILSDEVTAAHYQLGKRDANGVPIVEGQEFAWLDWLGQSVWYVYVLEGDGEQARWVEQGYHASEDAALTAATAIIS